MFLSLLAACGCRQAGQLPVASGAPIILISIDTLRADHLPAYGYGGVQTPAIDGLRRDAILYDNAYSHCPLTLPSHVSLLTGLLPPEHGVRNNLGYRLDAAAHPTLARRLRSAGYATGAAVSAYVLRADAGLADGFDWYDDALEGPAEGAEAAALVRRPGLESVGRALEWARGASGRPIFLFVHIYEPHYPYDPPEPYRSRYAAPYDAAIAAADAAVGALLDGLRRDGSYDRALIALVSDHGEGLGDHGEAEHGILLYREVLHVPLLLKLPRRERAGSRVKAPVGLMDLAPTLLRAVGVAGPVKLPGTDLLAPRSRPGAAVYSETYYPRIHLGWSELRSLIDDRYHYIGGPQPELYDLERDPREAQPLPSAEARAAAMKQALAAHEAGFTEAAAVDPSAAEGLKALGYLSAGPTAGSAAPQQRPNPREKIATYEAIKAGFHLTREDRDQEAVLAFERLLAQEPDLFDVQWELGATLARLGRQPEAVVAYEKAMKLSPSLAPTVALSLAEAQLQMGRGLAAERSAGLALATHAARAHVLLARAALQRGDLQRAEQQCAAADQAGARDAALLTLADVRVRQGRLEAALALVEPGQGQGAPGKPFAGLAARRGDVLARMGRNAEAAAALREETAAFPRNLQAWANLAIVSALMGRPREEVHGILDAMQRANPGPAAVRIAVQALEFMGDTAGARDRRRNSATTPLGLRSAATASP